MSCAGRTVFNPNLHAALNRHACLAVHCCGSCLTFISVAGGRVLSVASAHSMLHTS